MAPLRSLSRRTTPVTTYGPSMRAMGKSVMHLVTGAVSFSSRRDGVSVDRLTVPYLPLIEP